jgi:hypothetical protein
MNYAELITADIRLQILRALNQDADYSHNEAIIREVLRLTGHTVGRDRLRTEIAWLKEQGLVTVEDAGPVWVAKLTVRGADTATGCVQVPGVKRPGPED